ncbi:protein rolling stone-like isoform X2 [Ischnura elegans]|uniref:protein rolling stone-like isoform X2 n=1 Tax=Ischnura elegans TaxID=197161 RepID=UPI001ED88977|nr:protein rolling stone-like isoform X2 [Ischnura elegans]
MQVSKMQIEERSIPSGKWSYQLIPLLQWRSPMRPAANLVGNWRSRVKPHLFKLQHENPEVFVQCQWQRGAGICLPYLVYRLLLAATFLGILISSMCEIPKKGTSIESPKSRYEISATGDTETSSEPIFFLEKNKTEPVEDTGFPYVAKWPIYLTNWGITACTVQAVLGAVIILQKKFSRKDGSKMNEMPVLYQCYWALHTTACVIAPAITILYWGLVYQSEKGPPTAVGILVHGINSALMLTDLVLIAHPYRLHHFYFPVTLSIFYSIFTIIYFLAGGTSRDRSTKIYPQLDWSKPWTLAVPTLLGAFILVLIIHSSLYGLSLLRGSLGQRLKRPGNFYVTEGEDNRGANIGEHAFDVIDSNGFSASKGSISSVIINPV